MSSTDADARTKPPAALTPGRVLSTIQVMDVLGVSRTTIWRLADRGEFPPLIRLGPARVGYLSDDIARWIEGRKNAKPAPAAVAKAAGLAAARAAGKRRPGRPTNAERAARALAAEG